MTDKNVFEVEMVNTENDSTLNIMITTSAQICGTQLLDTSIEDVRNKKKTMVSKIDSVMSLMKEVEYEEKAAEQTKKEAAQNHSDIMLKVYELMHMQQHAKSKNDMLAREACVQKKLLSTKMEALQRHVTGLLDKGDRSIELLDDMSKSLEVRLTSAIMKKKSAINKKQRNEAFVRAALAYEEARMAKVEEERSRLKQEAVEISKLLEFLVDCAHLITMLSGEISDKCQDVKRLKEELDKAVPPVGKMTSRRKSSISVSSSSSVISSTIPCQPQPESTDSDVLFKKDSGFGIGDYKQIKSVTGFSVADIKNPHGVADVTKSIKNVKIKDKLYANHMFAKPTKKVKIKGLDEYQLFAKSIKKVKIKRKLYGNEMIAKSIKKVKIKCKLHGNQICAKRINKLKIKCKHHGSKMRAKSSKKLKMKGKRHGSKMCAKSVKNLKIYGSQMCAKSIKKVKIKGKLLGTQPCPKSVKQKGCQICAKGINKVKIKGLSFV